MYELLYYGKPIKDIPEGINRYKLSKILYDLNLTLRGVDHVIMAGILLEDMHSQGFKLNKKEVKIENK